MASPPDAGIARTAGRGCSCLARALFIQWSEFSIWPSRRSRPCPIMSAFRGISRLILDKPVGRTLTRHDQSRRCKNFGRFSNRPFWVKRFQTIHCWSVDVSRGLMLLFGLGTEALPSWETRTRWNNLTGGLAGGTAGPSDQTNSPHPSSREGHHSTAGWSSGVLLS
jgi:hypothetical protein